MRPVRIIATVVLTAAVAATGFYIARSTAGHPAAPARVERAAPTTTPIRDATPRSGPPATLTPKPAPDPRPERIVGLWPVTTLSQARDLQDSVDAGHQPWLLSAEQVSIAYARAELGLFGPFAAQAGPTAYQVRSHNGEWEATLYLAQPVRHDNGVWVVARVGGPSRVMSRGVV
jgi:hypothetical protein